MSYVFSFFVASIGTFVYYLGYKVVSDKTADRDAKGNLNFKIRSFELKFNYEGITGGLLAFGGIIIVILSMLNQSFVTAYLKQAVGTNALEKKLDGGVVSESYKIEETVKTQIGTSSVNSKTYAIDIQGANEVGTLMFDKDEYQIFNFNSKFEKSVANFKETIIEELTRKGIDFRIYVKGTADADPNKGLNRSIPKNVQLSKVVFHPKVNGSNYIYEKIPVPAFRSRPIKLTNDTLPNLRGAFIQKQLKASGVGSSLLQGDITLGENVKDRNARILLQIDWPSSSIQKFFPLIN